jgi:hypothetical protein
VNAGVARAALVYFCLVFGAGFVLGIARTLFVAPALGEDRAQLVEAPLMLVAIVLAARFIVRRWRGSVGGLARVGMLAASGVLAADLVVGVGLRGMSVGQVYLGRDWTAGFAYYGLLAVFAALPALLLAFRARSS